LTLLPPVAIAIGYGDGALRAFALSFALTLILGFICWLPTRHAQTELRHREGFIIVVLFWICISLLGSIPLLLDHHPETLTDAVFEAVSGITTTGATVLTNLDNLPHALLYYRAQLNFFGGLGIVVLAVALLPRLGIGGMQLYLAETPGPMKEDKIAPRIAETAKRLWYIYLALTLTCIVAYWLAGMNVFDAVAHGFATIALGGFSTHEASLGFIQNPAIVLIAGLFSFLAAINYALYFNSWRSRSLKPFLNDAEFRLFCVVVGTVVVIVCSRLYISDHFSLTHALRYGFFQTLSVMTDNGLVAADYPHWPLEIVLLLVFMSFFGGCAGSTCGGIKAMRVLMLYKQSLRELKLLRRPYAEIPLRINKRPVSRRVMQAVWAFYFLYISCYCLLSLALVATGIDLVTAFGSMAGCLNNMGVGLGITAGNFADLNTVAKWLLILAMLLGRLEVFPLLLLCVPDFWR
jgi:trk system potassium uptake protein TrkH